MNQKPVRSPKKPRVCSPRSPIKSSLIVPLVFPMLYIYIHMLYHAVKTISSCLIRFTCLKCWNHFFTKSTNCCALIVFHYTKKTKNNVSHFWWWISWTFPINSWSGTTKHRLDTFRFRETHGCSWYVPLKVQKTRGFSWDSGISQGCWWQTPSATQPRNLTKRALDGGWMGL